MTLRYSAMCAWVGVCVSIWFALKMPRYIMSQISGCLFSEWGSYSEVHRLGFLMGVHKPLKLYVNFMCVYAYMCVYDTHMHAFLGRGSIALIR